MSRLAGWVSGRVGPRMAALVLAAGMLFAHGPAAPTAAAQGLPASVLGEAAPWSVGEAVGAGWTVTEITPHPEFVRLMLEGPDGRRAPLEIVRSLGPEDPWSTELYRVQPAPGARLPDEVFRAARSRLRRWEAEAGHRPVLVDKAEAAAAREPSPEGAVAPSGPSSGGTALQYVPRVTTPPLTTTLWLAAFLAALLLGLEGARRGRRASRRARGVASQPWLREDGPVLAVAVAVVGAAGSAGWFLPDPIPWAWVQVLHEGATEQVLANLEGRGHHGAVVDGLRAWLMGDAATVAPTGLLAQVRLHLALCAAGWVGLGGAVALWRRDPLAAALTLLATGAAPWLVVGGPSETPVAHLLLIGLAAAGASSACQSPRWRDRAVGLLGLAAATVAFLGVRSEWAFMGLCALGAAVLSWAPTRRRRGAVAGLGAAVLAALAVLWDRFPQTIQELIADGLDPMENLGGYLFPAFWPLALGVGAMGLALVGWAVAMRHLWRLGGLGLSAPALWVVYHASAHQGTAPYELLRYELLALPALLGFVALGAGWLTDRATSRRVRLAVAALGLASCLWVPGTWLAPAMPEHHRAAHGPPDPFERPMARDQQLEVRAVGAWMQANPECVFVTVGAVEPRPGVVPEYRVLVYGVPVPWPLSAPYAPGTWPELLGDVPPEQCVLFVRGLGCAIHGGATCDEDVAATAQATRLDAHDVSGRPYYDHLVRRDEAVVELWHAKGPVPTSADASPGRATEPAPASSP